MLKSIAHTFNSYIYILVCLYVHIYVKCKICQNATITSGIKAKRKKSFICAVTCKYFAASCKRAIAINKCKSVCVRIFFFVAISGQAKYFICSVAGLKLYLCIWNYRPVTAATAPPSASSPAENTVRLERC